MTIAHCVRRSGVKYADSAMKFVLGPEHGQKWRELFDLIICSANKPTFFDSKRPFRKWSEVTNTASASSVSTTLQPGAFYLNGSVHALRRAKGQ